MNHFIKISVVTTTMSFIGCAHNPMNLVPAEEAARIDRALVKETVVYESGAKDGAIVPDLSAPRLRATWVPEHQENGRLIEAHREWALEGDVTILGIPKSLRKLK